jgi:hypothetical protein
VAVVEELGELANGPCARLEVVEIPDGAEWAIEETDGYEYIAEADCLDFLNCATNSPTE